MALAQLLNAHPAQPDLDNLAYLTRQNKWVIWIAPHITVDFEYLQRCGVKTQHILVIHPRDTNELRWCLEQLADSSICSAVYAWLSPELYHASWLNSLQSTGANDIVALPNYDAIFHQSTNLDELQPIPAAAPFTPPTVVSTVEQPALFA